MICFCKWCGGLVGGSLEFGGLDLREKRRRARSELGEQARRTSRERLNSNELRELKIVEHERQGRSQEVGSDSCRRTKGIKINNPLMRQAEAESQTQYDCQQQETSDAAKNSFAAASQARVPMRQPSIGECALCCSCPFFWRFSSFFVERCRHCFGSEKDGFTEDGFLGRGCGRFPLGDFVLCCFHCERG